jgi:acetyl esterase/lipase
MIRRKFEPILFGLVLSGLMSLLVSGISTFRATGLVPGFLMLWAGSWLMAWPTALAVELKDFLALPPTQQISYGTAPSQGIDVFLPAGPGPHPVAILIHGGCWSDFPGAGREQVRALAADWARRGGGRPGGVCAAPAGQLSGHTGHAGV